MKKVISFIMSFALVVSLIFPANIAYAAEDDVTLEESGENQGEGDISDEDAGKENFEDGEVKEGNLNGLKYLYNDEKVVVIGYTGTESDITIPKEIDGKPVTNLAAKAFYDNYGIENITIEAEIEEIPDYCFSAYNL